MNDRDWKAKLTPEQYKVLREGGTEAPFSGKFLYNKEKGMYKCGACGQPLFSSEQKYESHEPGLAGWPSFSDVLSSDSIELKDDNSLGMHRIEVTCKKCGSHLGHLFDDQDSPTNKHYCINSCALDFTKAAK